MSDNKCKQNIQRDTVMRLELPEGVLI
jgi:hypothetical protein